MEAYPTPHPPTPLPHTRTTPAPHLQVSRLPLFRSEGGRAHFERPAREVCPPSNPAKRALSHAHIPRLRAQSSHPDTWSRPAKPARGELPTPPVPPIAHTPYFLLPCRQGAFFFRRLAARPAQIGAPALLDCDGSSSASGRAIVGVDMKRLMLLRIPDGGDSSDMTLNTTAHSAIPTNKLVLNI